MIKIATHNSTTCEKSHGLLSLLVIPFSRCQSKTIKGQYESGCRYFDVRVKKNKRGWVCAHGLWQSELSADNILEQINSYGDCYVMLTYEGEATDDFLDKVNEWVNFYKGISFTSINSKRPQWKCLKVYNDIPLTCYYKILDGSTWHTYFPFPWLWKKIYYNKPVFNNEYFKIVDFL